MKIGAVFPHLEIGNDPAVIKDWAQTAEGLGYSHLLVYDHVLGAIHADRDPPLWGPYSIVCHALLYSITGFSHNFRSKLI